MPGNTTHANETASSERWLAQFFGTIDQMDAEGFARHFAADGQFRFANQPAAQGQATIAAGAEMIFGLLDKIQHEVIHHWRADGDLLVEGTVHYLRSADGKAFAFPFFSVFEFSEALDRDIASYRVFVDSHELFLPPES